MEEKTITGWKDLTLLQLGALLKYGVVGKNGRMYKEWVVFTDSICRENASYNANLKASGVKRAGYTVKGTQPILSYFFTFTAIVHRRFSHPEENPELKELVQEYHLDLILQDPRTQTADFEYYFCSMIPHNVTNLELVDDLNIPKEKKWINRTDEECVKICWDRLLSYLNEKDAPTAKTKAADALAWLEAKNEGACQLITTKTGTPLFTYRYECLMDESYPRFLQQMDSWNQNWMKLWASCQVGARRRIGELFALLDLEEQNPFREN